MAKITGTFTAAGQSASTAAPTMTIQLAFSGAGSVNVESQMPSGAWVVMETVTADYHKVVEQGGACVPIRLNCTAVTAPETVEYAITTI